MFNLYMGQKMKVCLDHAQLNTVDIGRDVSKISSMLNLYGEWLAKEALERMDKWET